MLNKIRPCIQLVHRTDRRSVAAGQPEKQRLSLVKGENGSM